MSKKNIVLATLSISIMLAVLSSPAKYVASCYQGLMLWATRLVPTLIPFCFLTSVLSHSGLPAVLSQRIGGVFSKIYGCSNIGSYVYLMSIISGYPVGADTLRELHSSRSISTRDVGIISTFASTSGPIFVIGTVGVGMFSSLKAGIVMYVVHILSALLNGLIYRKSYIPSRHTISSTKCDWLAVATSSTLKSTLMVGVMVTIFYLLADILVSLGVVDLLSSILPVPHDISYAILTGMVEMTRGCLAISRIDSVWSIPIANALISLGGGCIGMQSISLLKDTGVKTSSLILPKVTHALITLALSYITFGYVI